ncbi:MAG: hypothetical protein KH054_11330 [Firmicutes bacterium]|jgi:hypothetical protein|nr:hypothetical protein [Bacillota bacterium]
MEQSGIGERKRAGGRISELFFAAASCFHGLYKKAGAAVPRILRKKSSTIAELREIL